MSEATERANIKTILEAVTDIGKVYDYERLTTTWDAYLDFYKTSIAGDAVIRGWTITCQSIGQLQLEMGYGTGAVETTYTYKIRGFVGLNDSAATEKTAIALAVTVMAALDANTIIHDSQNESPLAQLDLFEPRMFGGVLCHYIEITQVIVRAA